MEPVKFRWRRVAKGHLLGCDLRGAGANSTTIRAAISLPMLRGMSVHALEATYEELTEDVRRMLLELYECWLLKFEATLSSSLSRVLLLPYYRVQTAIGSAGVLKRWLEVTYGSCGDIEQPEFREHTLSARRFLEGVSDFNASCWDL